MEEGNAPLIHISRKCDLPYRRLKVTDAVHEKGSYIYLQLWTLGRAADPKVLKEEDPDLPYVSASDVQLAGKPFPPRPLTIAGETFPIFLGKKEITLHTNAQKSKNMCSCLPLLRRTRSMAQVSMV